MQYTIKYDSGILWKGKTQYHEYTLHRALIISADEGWMLPGYALFAKSQAESNIAEVYAEGQIEPGNGLYGDQLHAVDETDKPLPPADPKDVQEFDILFDELCESGETPLLKSEFLL